MNTQPRRKITTMKINRRQFLRTAAAAGFGVLTGSLVSAQDATPEATAAIDEGAAL
jgi:secreted PhoX family phosphatase